MISALISVIVLGKYANYTLVMTGMIGLLNLVFTSITSIIGHYFIKSSKEQTLKQFNKIYTINILLKFIFFLGYQSIIEPLITIVFGSKQLIDNRILAFITVSYFTRFMRQSVLLFKDASGNFYHDRYKPLFQGLIIIILSIIFINFLGIIGLLVSHNITDLLIAHTIEPYVLFKYGFNKSQKNHYIYNYFVMILFTISIVLFESIKYSNVTLLIDLLINGILSIIVSLLFIIILILVSKRFRKLIKLLM